MNNALSSSSDRKGFKVEIDDNFDYMDKSRRVAYDEYETLQEAKSACKQIVDAYLLNSFQPGMSATDLYGNYTSLGPDPFIVAHKFSSWSYAKRRCKDVCGA